MKGEFYKWMIFDSLVPISVSFIIGIFVYLLVSSFPTGWYAVLYGIIIVLSSILVNTFIFIKRYSDGDVLFLFIKIKKYFLETSFNKNISSEN